MYYGLDLHKDFIQVAKLSRCGKKCEQWKVATTHEAMRAFAKKLKKSDKVVMETTFNTWIVYSLLKENCKSEILVANAIQVKAIASARIKTDKVDAHILAQLLRLDFVPEVNVPEKEIWEIRQLIAHRKLLSKQSTALMNSMKGLLNRKMLKPPRYLTSPKGKKWLKEQEFSEVEKLMIDNYLKGLESIESNLEDCDKKLVELASWNEPIRLLMTIPGVSFHTAMGIYSAIEDINRFKSPERLASYFGLVPSISQSGNNCYYGKITKTGNSTARWLLIEAANQMAINGTPLTATYYKIRKKKCHNVAVTALARKMTVLIWHMLKNREPYRYGAVTAHGKNKLKKVSPGLAQPTQGNAPKNLDEFYDYLGLPGVSMPSDGEKRASKANKRKVTIDRKELGRDKIVRGEKARKSS